MLFALEVDQSLTIEVNQFHIMILPSIAVEQAHIMTEPYHVPVHRDLCLNADKAAVIFWLSHFSRKDTLTEISFLDSKELMRIAFARTRQKRERTKEGAFCYNS